MALFTGRETNFYGSPVIKGFVIIVTSSSFLYHMFRSVLPSNEVLLTCLQSIGLPTASLWVMGVVLLYWIRPLERHLGSVKFIHTTLSSLLTAAVSHLTFSYFIPMIDSSISSYPIYLPGTVVYWLLGALCVNFMMTVRGNDLYRGTYFTLSSNIFIMLLMSFMLARLPDLAVAFISGGVGALATRFVRPLPLPKLVLHKLASLANRFAADKPPRLLSGATVDVQRQQHMDLIEGFIMNIQQSTQAREGGHYIPRDEQIRQLTMMGFRENDVRNALMTSNGNITRAVQILTTSTIQH